MRHTARGTALFKNSAVYSMPTTNIQSRFCALAESGADILPRFIDNDRPILPDLFPAAPLYLSGDTGRGQAA